MAGNMDVHDIRGCYFLDNAGDMCANISVVDVVCKESSKETGKEASLAREHAALVAKDADLSAALNKSGQ